MKLTPWSTAVRTMRIASSSDDALPRWKPPRPIAETRTPVLPRARRGISAAAARAFQRDSMGNTEDASARRMNCRRCMSPPRSAADRGGELGLCLLRPARLRLALGEEVDHLSIESGQVGGFAAGDPIAVTDHGLVDPSPAGIADVVLDRVIAAQRPAL